MRRKSYGLLLLVKPHLIWVICYKEIISNYVTESNNACFRVVIICRVLTPLIALIIFSFSRGVATGGLGDIGKLVPPSPQKSNPPHPTGKILATPLSFSHRIVYCTCIRQYFRVQIFSRIWPKFLQILSSQEFNFAILVVLSLVQIDMNQSENFRDKWFAKFAKIKPPRNIPRIQYLNEQISKEAFRGLCYGITHFFITFESNQVQFH